MFHATTNFSMSTNNLNQRVRARIADAHAFPAISRSNPPPTGPSISEGTPAGMKSSKYRTEKIHGETRDKHKNTQNKTRQYTAQSIFQLTAVHGCNNITSNNEPMETTYNLYNIVRRKRAATCVTNQRPLSTPIT